jgi:hypothetical protein
VVNTHTPVKWAGLTNTSFRYDGCIFDERGTCVGQLHADTRTQP